MAFQPTGPLLGFTGATSAPTSVQAITLNNEQSSRVCLTNAGAVACVVGWGQTDTQAKLAAAAGSTVINCFALLPSSQLIVVVPSGSYFSGITGSSTAAITVQAGNGELPW